MKIQVKGKLKIIIIACISMTFLLGAASKVELLDDQKKLINLDKAIEYAKPGGSWTKQIESNDFVELKDEEAAEDSHDDNSTDQESVEKEVTIVISVHGKDITFNGEQIAGEDLLKKKIEESKSEITRYGLVDDFADAKVYKEIIQELDEAGAIYEVY